MFEDGLGTEKNLVKAALWYYRAAKNGDLRAMNNLGNLYWHGKGVDQDKERAEMLYSSAAEKNSSFAKINLGLIQGYR